MSGVIKMMNKAAVKIAVSALAIGVTQVSCTAPGPASVSSRAPNASLGAAGFAIQAQNAQRKGDLRGALRFAEQAVELAPRDSGYRLALGDLYMKNGRFQSAATSFGDVLAIDPSNTHAALSLALSQIALGRNADAIARLDGLSSSAAPGDLGLAYALAGQAQRGIAMLEPAARAADATPRVRQNLALAYALAGDWQKAQAIAAQDISPADLAARMSQWASFVQPASASDQVAHLLGVTAAADPGQPARLALGPVQSDTAFAAAEPAPAPEAAPASYAAAAAPASTAPDPGDWGHDTPPRPAPQQEEVTQPVYAEAVQSLVTPQPAMVQTSGDSGAAPVIPFVPRQHFAGPRASGRFVVQLGAYSSPAGVERAWASAYRHYGFADHIPLSTTIRVAGRGTFHRLSVAGFESQAEAGRACQAVKSKGGACFVRAVAGDSPVRWASRYTNRPA
jgi:Flp pilus assembly protein TadD